MAEAEDYAAKFRAALQATRTGILSAGDGDAAAPMTAHGDGDGPLWFFAPADGVLAGAIGGASGAGHFHYVSGDHDLYAVLDGTLAVDDDMERRRALWSDEVEAWFPGGPEGSKAALLRLDPDDGQVWLSSEPASAGGRIGQSADKREKIDV